MKRIILMRHGKAMEEWNDWERSLASQGQDEVRGISVEILKRRESLPQWILCSEAKRAKQTLEIFSEFYFNAQCQTFFYRSLYHGSVNDLASLVAETPSDIDNLMIIGHNPILSEFVSRLVKDPVPLGTANAAILTSEALVNEWQRALYDDWKLSTLLKPGAT